MDTDKDIGWRRGVIDHLEQALLITRSAPDPLALAGTHASLIATHLARAWVRLEGRDEAILDEGVEIDIRPFLYATPETDGEAYIPLRPHNNGTCACRHEDAS